MSEKNLIKTITAFIFIIVVGAPFFYFPWGVYPYTLAKILFFQAAVEIVFFLWLALAISSPRYRPRLLTSKRSDGGQAKPTPLLIAGSVFLSAMFLASINGIDFGRSFWSSYARGIGFFATLHFAALGLIVSSLYRELPWKKIFYSSLAVSVAVDLIAYAQLYIPNLLLIEKPGYRPGATFGNPTFMAGYLVIHVFLAVYLLFRLLRERNGVSGKPYAKILLVAGAGLLDAFTVFFAQTRGDIIGLAAGALTLLFIFSIKPPEDVPRFLSKRKTYAVLMAILISFAAVFFMTRDNLFWSKIPGLTRFSSISFSNNSSIAPRLFALSAGWRGFLEKPFLGWGPENFAPLYDRYYDPRSLEFSYAETHFDKPHNLFLEYADSGGIILFLAFLAFFSSATYEVFKQKDALWRAVFLALLVSYGVSQFFFFETIGPLLMLYLFFGATDGAFREKSDWLTSGDNRVWRESSGSTSPAVLYSCLALSLVLVYSVNLKSLSASYYQYMGFQNFLSQNIFAGLRSFESAVNTWSPYLWNFKRDYAIAVAGQYFNYPGTVADEDVLKAVKAMEDVRDEHPEDAFNHYALVNLYNEVANIDKKKYTQKAEAEAKIALEISPGRQETYFYLAKTKVIEGDYAGAFSLLKKVLDDNPKVPDSHFYYGLLAFAVGEQTIGYNEIKTALSMGRKWNIFYEPRTVGGFFADSGHLDEALELYKTAWSMSSNSDIESEVKIGVAYFYKGQYDEAKFYLKDAVGKFDIKKSPSYSQLEPILKQLGITIPGQ